MEKLLGEYTGEECADKPPTLSSDGKNLGACGTASRYTVGEMPTSPNPINFATGNKYFHTTDYRGSGSFPIVFDRSYNSYALGWRYAYTQRVDNVSETEVAVRRPNGQSFDFRLESGQWQSDPDVTDRLEDQTDANGNLTGWRYRMANHKEEWFDAQGRLLKIRNANGLEQTLSYSADGNQFFITVPQGDTLLVTLNGIVASSIEDAHGRVTLFNYDGPYLRDVTYPNGTSKQYLYEVADRPWLITGIIDENGHRSNTVAYDDQGRAIMSELASGAERVEVSYNLDGTTTLTNALGKKTTFEFIVQHGVKKIVHVEGEPTATCQGTAMDYRFDDNGFLIEKTDAKGVVTSFTRDSHGLELSRTEAVGLPEARTTTTEWDSEHRRKLRIVEGNTETRNVYDDDGRLIQRTQTDLISGSSRTTTYTYSAEGVLNEVDGPREDVADITTYSYDEQGRLQAVTNALGHSTEIFTRDAYGRPTVTRDANGLESQMVYDDNGRIIERRVGTQVTTMAYDAVGNLIEVAAPGDVVMRYEYDAANRLIAISDANGNSIHYALDAMGNRTSEAVYDPSANLIRTQQKVYDELSRLLQSIGADGARTTYVYDRNDNLVSTLDPLQQLHQSAYDGLNRLIEQTDALNGVTQYGYDSGDNLTSVTDPNGNTTVYVYDGLGNLTEQHSPDTGITTYTHDAAGNVITKTDAKGEQTLYSYDALNRLTHTLYADGSEVVYTYDTAANGIGRLAQLSDSSGTTEWQYDSHGRTVARSQHITVEGGIHTLTTAWEYNSDGQLVAMTYPSGMVVGYAYENGKLSHMTINGEPLLNAITYQPFGSINGWQWSNGTAHHRDYDLNGRLVTQQIGNTERRLSYDVLGNISAINDELNTQLFDYDALSRLTAANDAVFNLAWEYDANGNRLSETSGDITTPYTIDMGSNRLLAVGDSPNSFDAIGNLIQASETSYQYDARGRLTGIDDGATGRYYYNALGQRIYKWGMMKNGANPDLNGDGIITQADIHQLQEYIKNGGAPGTADLNGDGTVDNHDTACIANLIGESKNNGTDKEKKEKTSDKIQGVHSCLPAAMPQQYLFAYDEHRVLGEYKLDGSAEQETVWLGNMPVATIKNDEVYYIHADHLGTPRVISDTTNIELWRWDSDPFGTAAANEDVDGDGQRFSYNLRFPGQYYDGETGKHYNYFRDYDPATGRYIQSDPIGLMGGINTYGYVNSNPMMLIDPRGLKVIGELLNIDISSVSVSNVDWAPNLRELEPGLWQYGTVDFTMSGNASATMKCTKTEDGECADNNELVWVMNASVSASKRASIPVREIETLPPVISHAVLLMDAMATAGEYAYQHKDVLKAIARGLINPTLICEGDWRALTQ